MGVKTALAILTAGTSLIPGVAKFDTLGLYDPNKQKASSPLVDTTAANNILTDDTKPNKQGILPLATSPLGDTSTPSLSRSKLLGN
jgi:hypothetical protein